MASLVSQLELLIQIIAVRVNEEGLIGLDLRKIWQTVKCSSLWGVVCRSRRVAATSGELGGSDFVMDSHTVCVPI